MARLFSPLRLRGMTIRNRVVMSPMSQNAADRGCVGAWHLVHYGSRAVGGCGMVMLEDTAIAPSGRVSTRSLCLYSIAHAHAMSRVVEFCKSNGTAVGVQLSHAGRKARRDRQGRGGKLVSSTSDPFDAGWKAPVQLEEIEIAEVVGAFANSARLALQAGVDAVEVHAAHGYLLHQFLSPMTNRREGVYGGPTGGVKLLREVCRAVRSAAPDLVIFARLPAHDGIDSGLSREAVVEISAGLLSDHLVDVIDVGGNGVAGGAPPLGAADMVASAAQIRSSTGGVVASGGLGASGETADAALADGLCDLVVVGRPLLADPYWVAHQADRLGGPSLLPERYQLARGEASPTYPAA